LRSESTALTDQGATILGIVGQDLDDLREYIVRSPLPFPLLSDDARAVMKSYEVYNALSFDAFRMAHPSAFIVDPAGVIRYAFVASNQMDWPQTSLLAAELAAAKRKTE
jgi:peroxiredoxin